MPTAHAGCRPDGARRLLDEGRLWPMAVALDEGRLWPGAECGSGTERASVNHSREPGQDASQALRLATPVDVRRPEANGKSKTLKPTRQAASRASWESFAESTCHTGVCHNAHKNPWLGPLGNNCRSARNEERPSAPAFQCKGFCMV